MKREEKSFSKNKLLKIRMTKNKSQNKNKGSRANCMREHKLFLHLSVHILWFIYWIKRNQRAKRKRSAAAAAGIRKQQFARDVVNLSTWAAIKFLISDIRKPSLYIFKSLAFNNSNNQSQNQRNRNQNQRVLFGEKKMKKKVVSSSQEACDFN